jgi:hypothetical protein
MANLNEGVFGVGSVFQQNYRLLLWSIDVLGGDNPLSNSIADHGMVDADMLKFELDPPGIFLDWQQGNREVAMLAKKYNLLGLPGELRNLLQASVDDIDPSRMGVLLREIAIAEVRIHDILVGHVEGAQKIEFADMWSVVTGETPPTILSFKSEISQIHDTIITLLARKNISLHGSTLKQSVEIWEHCQRYYGVNDVEEITNIVRAAIDDFFPKFCQFALKVPALAPFVSLLTKDACDIHVLPNMNFDAGSSYIGGNNPDGTVALKSLYEWNAGRPATAIDIQYIAIHEFLHAMNAQFMDLQRRDGLLGCESALLTMSSSRVCVEEGLAQTGLEMVYGSFENVVDALGIDFGIVMLLDQLQDIARVFASVGHNLEWQNLNEEDRRLQIYNLIVGDLLQSEHIGNKYAGPTKKWWRMNIGGIMHSPSYYYGSRAFRKALETNSPEEVFAVATHNEGPMDLQAFKKRFSL